MQKINIDNWSRKEHFLNFIQFDDPFFNICGDVNVTNLKSISSQNNISFFILSYFGILKIVNQIEEFKYRIRDNEVIKHEKIRGSCPILRSDRTFAYGYFNHFDDFLKFKQQAEKEIDSIKSGKPLNPKFDEDDMIHSSVIPWVSFKSIEHAKRLNKGDSIPKIVTGKIYKQNNQLLMPVSVSGHHALMDGLHAGEFFKHFEQYCSHPVI